MKHLLMIIGVSGGALIRPLMGGVMVGCCRIQQIRLPAPLSDLR